MKKFDFLLVIFALGLIGLGYYFSQGFKTESGITSEKAQKHHSLKDKNKKRLPSANDKEPKKQRKQPRSSMYFEQYKDLKKCLSGGCGYPETDPRSYELEALSAINKHLDKIDFLNQNQAAYILKDAVKLPSGHIKATVLKHIKEMSLYDPALRDLVLQEVVAYHDSKLIPDALNYLKEFSSNEDRTLIHEKIYEEIAHGSPMVANALAENIKSLLDSNALDFYKSNLSSLQEGPIKTNLKRQLRDYELMSSAG